MVAQLTGAEGPVSVRAMHVASPGQKKSGGGAKHAPGHRSTSTIRENGSGAKCDARSYDTAEATKYPHFRPVAFEVGRTAVPKIIRGSSVNVVRERPPSPPQPVYTNLIRFQSHT